ncbi:hypothetical protein DFJ74DRAFT_653411 [Hyaloraphidium curvatum]|nr:hypothetical protein DFJ74DRAFT_653411 [Hyaloraphidium curvatum]
MGIYCLYLFLRPIARGFTSDGAYNSVPPLFCDNVVGQNYDRYTLPTYNQQYCADVDSEWRRSAAATGVGIGIMFVAAGLGAAIRTANETAIKLLGVKRLEMENELRDRKLIALQNKVTDQQQNIVDLQSERAAMLGAVTVAVAPQPAPQSVIAPVPNAAAPAYVAPVPMAPATLAPAQAAVAPAAVVVAAAAPAVLPPPAAAPVPVVVNYHPPIDPATGKPYQRPPDPVAPVQVRVGGSWNPGV